MNAVLREEYEAPVLTNEAIEVHLSYLRPAVDAIQAELPVLRNKIEALDEKLTTRIEKLDEKLTTRIEKLDEKLTTRIEKLDGKLTARIDAMDVRLTAKIEAGDDKLAGKIDTLTVRVLEMQASQNGLKWFLSSVALIAAGTSIAHTFGWI